MSRPPSTIDGCDKSVPGKLCFVAMIFKDALPTDLRTALTAAGYEVRDLPRNPYLG